ncbi:MAG: tryptophan-rich sensory protein [Modestobacter sp.]|jgi:tryptophan-rich sensory protein|nr:tryptophan-rich sensory protein [Blastococcus sp.]MCW2575091.1 tryptophan-rich sensory protein [Modestobacter sp.]
MSPRRERLAAAAVPLAAAVLGGLATDPHSHWFRALDTPSWYPPPQAFGIVWTGLYAGTVWAGGEVLPQTPAEQRRSFARAFAANLVLNAAWTPVFFRPTGRGPRPSPGATERSIRERLA